MYSMLGLGLLPFLKLLSLAFFLYCVAASLHKFHCAQVVAFIFLVTFKSVAFLSVTQQMKSHNRPKATIRPQ